jgi:hypothetical protein
MTGITSELNSSKVHENESVIDKQDGGRRRRRKSSKRHGGSRKPTRKGKRGVKGKPGKRTKKSPSKWIIFVKNFASKSKKSYMEALKDPKCKAEYHKKH